jgi:hypothetical protein
VVPFIKIILTKLIVKMKRLLFLATFVTLTINSFGQAQENLKIVWPEEYKWKIGSNQEDSTQHMIELIPSDETIDKWTIIGTMLSVKGVQNAAMNIMFEQTKQSAIKPTLTLIERNDTTKNAWIIFKIETPRFKGDKNPESQLYYIIQGNTSLYMNFVAIKEKSLSNDFVEKWTKVFKSSELLYQ